MAEVVLVNPGTLGTYRFAGKPRESYALCALGGVLQKEGVSFDVIDARLENISDEETADRILRNDPKLVGYTFMGPAPANWTTKVQEIVKSESPNTHQTAGGYFPTLDPKKCFEIIPGLDSIARGEGENVLLGLMGKILYSNDWHNQLGLAFKSGDELIQNPRESLIQDLDTLPMPYRYTEQGQIDKIAIEGSRGCLSSCNFCSVNPQLHDGKAIWRSKSPERIANEYQAIRSFDSDVHQIRFVDTDFVGSPKHAERITELSEFLLKAGASRENVKYFVETQSVNALSIKQETWLRLVETGLHNVFFGIERGDEAGKKRIGKRSSIEDDKNALTYLSGLGINVTYGFIMLDPWTVEEEVRTNILTLMKIGDADLGKFFSEMILNPGTRAYGRADKEGLIKNAIHPEESWEMYSYPLPIRLENYRSIGYEFLVNQEAHKFLERNFGIYERVKALIMAGKGEVALPYRKMMDEMNARIVSKVLDCVSSDEIQSQEQLSLLSLRVIEENNAEMEKINYALNNYV